VALTLTEGELYSTTDILSKTVIDRLVKDDPILQKLPFETLLGNSDTYATVTTRSGAVGIRGVGDTWTESTPNITDSTVTLKLLGGDADIDNFLIETRSNKLDLKGTVLNDRTVAVKEYFTDLFYYGTAFDAAAFSGMHQFMTSTTYNTVHCGTTATGGVLTIKKLREAIDLIHSFTPDMICMSKVMRRYLDVYYDSIGDKLSDTMMFGKHCPSFDGIPIVVSDHITDTETISSDAFAARTGGACSSIFILSFGSEAVCGVQGSTGLKVKPLGDLETKDASRYRFRWPCALKFKNIRSSAKLDGVDSDGTVTA
jgi:hypothetical protein